MLETPHIPAGADPEGSLSETTTQGFSADVLQGSRDKPVLVDFWAPWCGPCKQLTPALEKVAQAAGDRIKIVKMNIDEHPAIAGQLGIQSIPAVIAFVEGRPVDGFMGALPEDQIRDFVERLIGPLGADETDRIIAEAHSALEANDLEAAAGLYAAMLEQDDANVEARVGLARSQLLASQPDLATATLDALAPAKANDPSVAAIKAEIALAQQTVGLGDAGELAGKVAADPEDHEARFELALLLAAHGDRAEAAAHLLHIVRRDRLWNDDGARRQLVQFFDAWGPTDPATIDGRRRLSSILFA